MISTAKTNPSYQSALKGEVTYIRKFIKNNIRTKQDAIEFINKGLFAILEKITAKEVYEYLNSLEPIEYADGLRENMKAKGAYIESNSRMQFWETDIQEQYLSLVDFYKLKIVAESYGNLNKKQQRVLNLLRDEFMNIHKYFDVNKMNFYTYKKLVTARRFDIIDILFNFNPGINNLEILPKEIYIADLFGGNGNWLYKFKSMIPRELKSKIKLIYNELDINKYESNHQKFDFSFNKPAEELTSVLPKKNIGGMIFNPPYGNVNGVRNVNRFLRMILEENILSNNAVVAFALNKTDIIDNKELIAQNFNINITSVKKFSNKKEFAHLKQFYFIGIKRNEKLMNYSKEANALIDAVNIAVHDKQIDYNEIPMTDFKSELEFLEINKNPEDYSAPNDLIASLSNDMQISEAKKINVPKTPTAEEIPFYISSGYLNGKFLTENGEELIVASGVKEVTEKHFDDLTKAEYDIIKKVPYMNIIKNGTLKEIVG